MENPHIVALRRVVFAALGISGCNAGSVEPCLGAEAILNSNGKDSGFVRCSDGSINRITAVATDPPGPGNCALQTLPPGGGCLSDEECAATARCMSAIDGSFGGAEGVETCYCQSFCVDDAACEQSHGPGWACVSPDVAGPTFVLPSCHYGECQDSGDCPSKQCGMSSFHDGCRQSLRLSCRTGQDDCRVNSECPTDDQGQVTYCTLDRFHAWWTCIDTDRCEVGRPFRVEHRNRFAHRSHHSDWQDDPQEFSESDLDERERQALGEYWALIAAFEHASVASFARFTLHLLSHGAPASLLIKSSAAMSDEIEHARLSYGLAARYLGSDIGPGPLAIEGAVETISVHDFIDALIHEACVGETIAVARAAAALNFARDPSVRKVLLKVVADETKHAALAWETLVWAVHSQPDTIEFRNQIRQSFEHAIRGVVEASQIGHDVSSPQLAMHGLLSSTVNYNVTLNAIESIIEVAQCRIFDRPNPRAHLN